MKKRSVKTKSKIIRFAELRRLSFQNAKKMPKLVVIDEVVHRWVGIGWFAEDTQPTPQMVRVVE